MAHFMLHPSHRAEKKKRKHTIHKREERKMINNILVPVDGSDHAFKVIELAANMAKQDYATVYLLNVVKKSEITEPVLDYIKSEGIKDTPYVVYQQLVESQIIAPAIVEAKDQGFTQIKSNVIKGDPAEEIIIYAKERDIDMIVMGSRGLGSVKSFMTGSVSTKVCHGIDWQNGDKKFWDNFPHFYYS